ncbi:hypothetical protein RFI_35429, partial [Reticulomyxa filosa]
LFVYVLEKVDWNEFKDIAVSDDLINYYKDLHDSSHQDENNSRSQLLKIQITLEAMKYMAKECITEVCSIPKELIERVNRNLNHCSGSPSMTDSDSTNISHAIVLLRGFIEKYHNINEEENLTKLQEELEQIEVLPILIEQQTSDNMYWIVPKQTTHPRRLRIYLYCPGCTKIKSDRIRTNKQYPLKLVRENIPWLYWSDFEVAPKFEILCSISNQKRKVATATISASSQVIVVEEKSLRSKSNQKRVAVSGNMTRTSATNIKHVEIFGHLFREIEDESSFCIAVTIVKDLKKQLSPSESDIKAASIDIIPKLNQLDVTPEQ